MSVASIVDRIRRGMLTRTEVLATRDNALRILRFGTNETQRPAAQSVLDACDSASLSPLSTCYNFMGFCPSADFENRRDVDWKAEGICTFDFDDSRQQAVSFASQLAGDWIILKKRQTFGKTMILFGFGKITSRCANNSNRDYFEVDWSGQERQIEVPLMGCNKTVNIRSLQQVEEAMPKDFWDWFCPYEKYGG